MFPQTLVVLLVVANLGFGAKVVVAKPRFKRNVCSSTSVGNTTVINYPGTNGDYLNNAYCDWRVCTNTSSASVRITRMDIESHPVCSYDAVSIQGFKYCGGNTRDLNNVSTSNGCILVQFTSDSSVTRSGFTLEIRPGQVNTTSNSTYNSSNSSGNSTFTTASPYGNYSYSNQNSSYSNSTGNSTLTTASPYGNYSYGNQNSSYSNSTGNSTLSTASPYGNYSYGNQNSSYSNSTGNSTLTTASPYGNYSYSNQNSSYSNSTGNSTLSTASPYGNYSYGNQNSSYSNSTGNSTLTTASPYGNYSYGNQNSSYSNSTGNSTLTTASPYGNYSYGNQSSSNNCVLATSVGNMTEIDYPGTGDYPNYASCEWNVCTNTTQARISITKMDIEAHSSCSYDSLKIQNSKYCGLSTVSFAESTNQGCVQVSFTSDYSVTKTGFTVEIRPM
ncbi:probable serine/threonine-protein kinase clkA [Patella vulgata]|uniref:probable serine/threonine-protein kinase clkA n=1 Tax=Patella vulgata TaxID=6465 RepID=UPI0021805B1B|nr:probable serine/threonine-protein kinase clkA [Patella vulgata]